MKQAACKTIKLLEDTLFLEGVKSENVDWENGIIRDVKVLGRFSKNGREYSDKAIDDSCRLCEGIKVYFNHNRDNPRAERGFMESIGRLQGLNKQADGSHGDFHFKKEHPSAKLLCESATRFSNDFGLSHNAEGSLVRRHGKMIVESLQSVKSVDIVNDPATNSGLFESADEEPVMKKKTVTVKGLIESAKDKAKRYTQVKLAKLLEMEGGDSAMMSAPVDVMSPDGDGADNEADPDDLIDDAFAAMVSATMSDSTLDLKGKIDRITEILTAQDSLMNGATAKPAATPPGDKAVAESEQLKTLAAGIQSLIESQKQTAAKQAEQDAKFLLLESKREPLADRVKSLVDAKDDAHRKLLMESWPQVEPVATVKKPKSGSVLMESEVGEFAKEPDAFLRAIGVKPLLKV